MPPWEKEKDESSYKVPLKGDMFLPCKVLTNNPQSKNHQQIHPKTPPARFVCLKKPIPSIGLLYLSYILLDFIFKLLGFLNIYL